MRMTIASVAALALISGAALADPGKGEGKGNGNGKGDRPAAAARADGADKSAARGGPRTGNPDSGREQGKSAGSRAKVDDRAAPSRRGNGDRVEIRQNRLEDRVDDRGDDRREDRQDGGRDFDERVRFVDRADGYGVFREYDRRVAAYQGCPPGLAKKYNGCIPPGLKARQPVWQPAFFGYDGYGDTRYYYDDGFLLRLGTDGRIVSTIPLLGGALAIGNPWPEYYRPVELRPYYANYYDLGPNSYRYANNVIYRVDPETAAITSIAALLTGDDFTIGQPVPAGYDVYNVPYAYRDQYRDGPDGYYRYSDGYVYRMDPETRLVAAVIELALD